MEQNIIIPRGSHGLIFSEHLDRGRGVHLTNTYRSTHIHLKYHRKERFIELKSSNDMFYEFFYDTFLVLLLQYVQRTVAMIPSKNPARAMPIAPPIASNLVNISSPVKRRNNTSSK